MTAIQKGRAIPKPSVGEATLAQHLKACGHSPFWTEYRFHPERKWRADFAFPEQKLLIEVEGGTWSAGRHSRGSGFATDCEKYAEAAILGYRVIRVTTDQVRTGQAIEWIGRALATPGP